MESLSSLHLLTEAVRGAGADIAPTYQEYIQLAFAIATDCGEVGRQDFLTLCSLSPKYDRRAADKLFSNALRNGRNNVHLGTAFHLAELCGVKLRSDVPSDTYTTFAQKDTASQKGAGAKVQPSPHTHTCTCKEEENSEMPGSDPRVSLPTFDGHSGWPYPLEEILKAGTSPAQRDVLLLGALTVLGAGMGRNVRSSYGGKMVSPSLQTFVVALPAAGKGILSLVRLLAEPIHDEIRQAVTESMKSYRREKAAYDAMGKERGKAEIPEMPLNKMFLISGNNTGTGILQNIIDSDGTGLICESEADTISAAIGSEYGHWSDTLRKAFDHDRLSYNRRTDQEYREVKKSYLSVLLSGTPAQVKPLIPSTENGLFSRQLFYYMHGIWAWINQFESGEADLEAIFTDIGLEWKKQLDLMKTHGVHTLRLTDEQKQEFNTLFSDLFFRSGLANDNEMSSSIARLAVNTCRIMAEVAMIRALECNQPYQFKNSSIHLLTPDKEIATDNIKDGIITRWDVTITAEDFKAVLELVTPLYRHATHILSFLPSTEVKHRANADRDALFEAMGNQFTRAQLSEQATIMKIKPNTAFGWLNRLIKKGLFTNADDKGIYTRTHVCVC